MRHRKSGSVSMPDSKQTSDINQEESVEDFQAVQTEKSAMALMNMRVAAVCWLPVLASRILVGGLTVQGVVQALPCLILWALLCRHKHYLQERIKHHPVKVAAAVQCIAHVSAVYGMVSTALHMPERLVQHRVFLIQFLPMYIGAAANLYVPMPIFLSVVCPLYFLAWLFFHAAVNFITVPGVFWAICLSGVSVYIRHYQASSLWTTWQATLALQKERQLLKATQKSFQGILSSIFDASCTCERNGQLKDFSPQLQDLLGIYPLAVGAAQSPQSEGKTGALNLCSFAATDLEAARLLNFLTCTSSGAHNQASKIQCKFRRGESTSQEQVDACLYAITLQDCTINHGGEDSLFVVLESQSTTISKVREGVPEESDAPSMQTTNSSVEDSINESSSRRCEAMHVKLKMHAPSQELRSSSTRWQSSDEHPANFSLSNSLASRDSPPEPYCDATNSCAELEQNHVAMASEDEPMETSATQFSSEQPHSVLSSPSVADGNEHATSDSLSLSLSVPSSTRGNCCSVGVQTVTATKTVMTQTDAVVKPDLPPRSPESRLIAQGKKTRRNHAWQKKRPNVELCSTRRILPHFAVTPQASIRYLFNEPLHRINASGSGCCGYHISLAVQRRILDDMYFQKCTPEFTTYDSWQCAFCLCMNEVEDPMCQVCECEEKRLPEGVVEQVLEDGASSSCSTGFVADSEHELGSE